MDYSGGYSGGNVVQIMPGGGDNWMQGVPESAVWATEDEYRVWNNGGDVQPGTPSNSSHDQRPSQTRSGSEPPNKKPRGSQDAAATSNRSKAIGKMFFKTKLCCKFRAGTCPYVTNCNFAHSIEELRRPPPNWQEIVAAHEEERGVSSEPPREEFQIPSVGSTNFAVETPRSSKGRHCKKFYSEEGCPYGESCTFLHDEQSKNRESVVISLGPGGYGAGGGGGGGGNGGGGGGIGGGGGGGSGSGVVVVAAGAAAPSGAKPSNWKTRICNKWELTGYCPFGSKCHFAHGAGELHRYGGGLVDIDGRDSSTAPPDSKQGGVPSKTQADIVVASVTSAPHLDGYHMGLPSQRSSLINQRPGQRALHKWKGPNKISRIYGDWIDDIE